MMVENGVFGKSDQVPTPASTSGNEKSGPNAGSIVVSLSSNQTKPNQTEPNRTEPNQTKPSQTSKKGPWES